MMMIRIVMMLIALLRVRNRGSRPFIPTIAVDQTSRSGRVAWFPFLGRGYM